MPILKDYRKTKVITLPSFPDSKIEVYDSVLVGELAKFGSSENTVESAIKQLPYLIKSWNFTDEAEKLLPITKENLGFFKAEDLTFILNEIGEFSKEAKKK